MLKIHTLLLILSIFLIQSYQAKDTVIDESNFILKILRKHDPESKLFFTKEQYSKVLAEVILQGVEEGGDKTTEREAKLITEAIELYVDTKKVKGNESIFKYEELQFSEQNKIAIDLAQHFNVQIKEFVKNVGETVLASKEMMERDLQQVSKLL